MSATLLVGCGVMVFQPAFGVDCGHATRTRRGNRLSIRMVLHVTAGKDARNVRP
jgi:hypothetical protein